MQKAATGRDSSLETLLVLLTPALIAVAAFFSWTILINSLRIPFYLQYERVVFLIYLGRTADRDVWILSSLLALGAVTLANHHRGRSIRVSILLLSSGIVVGILSLSGTTLRLFSATASLATLTGCAVAGLGAARSQNSGIRRYFGVVFLLALSLLILPAELGALLYYVLSASGPGIQVGKSWELLELQLWYTAFPLIPFLYVAFLFSWVWAPLVGKILRSPTRAGVRNLRRTGAQEGWSWVVGILAYVSLTLFLGYYPYFHDWAYPLVGTDIYWRNALPAERVVASESLVAAAAKERHPIVVLAIACLSSVTGLGVESLLRFVYVGLILLFGLAAFLLVLVASRDITLASFTTLMSTVTATTTSGIYTGIVANWVALIVWTFSLTLLAIDWVHGLRRLALIVTGIGFGSLAVLIIHPWTWTVMMVGLLAYAIVVISYRMTDSKRDFAAIMVVVLLNAVALTASLSPLGGTQGWRVAEAFALIQSSLRSAYFGVGSWQILVFFSQIWSQFLNPVMLILSVVGAFALVRRRDRLSAIFLAWLVAACAANLLAAPMGYSPLMPNRGETQIFRAMFLTPFAIPLAAAVVVVKAGLESRLRGSGHAWLVRAAVCLVIVVAVLAAVNGAFRALYPLLTDPHNYPWPDRP